MSTTKEEIEQEFKDFKTANPRWMENNEDKAVVASYNNRLASLTGLVLLLFCRGFYKLLVSFVQLPCHDLIHCTIAYQPNIV